MNPSYSTSHAYPSHPVPSPQHTPVPMEDSCYNAFAVPVEIARSQETFRNRSPKRFQYADFDEVDLSMDYDSKLLKAQKKRQQEEKSIYKRDWRITACLTLWACYVRLWNISKPSSVVFDEVHFGGFASKYINKEYFVDVHPPVAKMMIALVAKLTGFDGSFDFKDIGKDYLASNVPYVPIRVFCALNGLLLVPMAYWTMRQCGHSVPASVLTALMVCYENGLITNNRLILLDPILLCYTAATTLAWINFHNQQSRPFKLWWYVWLILTGLCLGLAVSCKWVGLFTIATIGMSTLKNLWEIWGDTRVRTPVFVRHFGMRVLCLIVLPVAVYMLAFSIHFHMVTNSGSGNGFMSPQFQQTLNGTVSTDSPVDIAYGSKISVRHVATRGGYLHSHPHDYPTGSKQQQVTLYHHKDNNSWWVIQKKHSDKVNGIEYVRHGDIVRLVHMSTGKRLHSHNVRAPMTDVDYHNEVSAYGGPGSNGDNNDFWRVEIVDYDKQDQESKDRLRTIHSKFRLVHTQQHCALFSHTVKLPKWGWEQQEVTCMKNAKQPKTIWMIDSAENDLLPPDAERVSYEQPGFLAKLAELNKVMWDINQGLTSSHPYDSRPDAWPLLHRGINFWGQYNRHVYLLGNPLVYWLSAASVGLYIVLRMGLLVLDKRGLPFEFGGLRRFYEESAGFFLIGWVLHYTPFFLMSRQLFLHHYMPALYFAILLFGATFDMLTVRLVSRNRVIAAIVLCLCVISVYRQFIPITYGEPWTRSGCAQHKWRSSWDFDCVQYHKDLSSYYGTQREENIVGKMQNVIKGYFDYEKEQPPKVEDVVDRVSDGVAAPAESSILQKKKVTYQDVVIGE